MTVLDLGDGRVSCLIGFLDPDGRRVRVLGGSSVRCRALRGGVVLNIPAPADAIRRVVREAEASAGRKARELWLGVKCGHLKWFRLDGAVNITRTDGRIAGDAVNAALSAAWDSLPAERRAIWVERPEFAVDRQVVARFPVGMRGSLLQVSLRVVAGLRSYLANALKAAGLAGRPACRLMALGDLLMVKPERRAGTLLIDIGRRSTSVALHAGGRIRFTHEVPLGSESVTRFPRKWRTERIRKLFATVSGDIRYDHRVRMPPPCRAVLHPGGAVGRRHLRMVEGILGMPLRFAAMPPDLPITERRWMRTPYAHAYAMLARLL